MIRIGQTHVVAPQAMLVPGADIERHAAEEERATEKVKRLIDAAVRWRRSGKHDDAALFDAVEPFMPIDTD